MNSRQKQLDKERVRALGDLLVAECKSKDYNISSIDTLLENGAELSYKNSAALYFACKHHKFDLTEHLIKKGAVTGEYAKSLVASICDYKNFDDETEKKFFALLDLTHSKTGDYMSLFRHYINAMAGIGRLDKLKSLMQRYYLSESEVAVSIEQRIIFEIIRSEEKERLTLSEENNKNKFREMLDFIEKHNDWIDQSALDLSVATGEVTVLNYILKNSALSCPSDNVVAKIIYEGNFEILDILDKHGYNFSAKPEFLEKACRAAYAKGTKSLEFLLKKGYSIFDKYKGKTPKEHAEEEKNTPLIEYLKNIS